MPNAPSLHESCALPGFRQTALVATSALVGLLIWDVADSEDRCAGLSREQAVSMATEAKRHMLGRSTETYRANHASDAVASVALQPQAGGYSARVEFRGLDGSSLVTLIEPDCYIGWTGR